MQIDDKFLEDLGYEGLTEEKKQEKIGLVFRTLHSRVAIRLAEDLDEKQFDDYLVVIQSEELMKPWLEVNVPNYEEIIQEELANIKEEFTKDRADIKSKLEAAKQKAQQKEG